VGAKAAIGNREGSDSGPLRQCAVTRAQKPVDDLIRFVPDPEGRIVPDLARRLPGRGVWVDATRQAVENAVRRRAFARSLKRPVVVPEDLPDQVERLMARRLAEAVSLANKAGLLVAGFAKVHELIERGRAVLLIHAADAAEDGASRLSRKLKALLGPERAAEAIVTDLTGPQLDLAIGRSNVVHAAASEGGASRRIHQEARRLRRYRSGNPSEQRSGTQDVHERNEGNRR
jgi:predicted RNA-binding protein YlxR (DUF448 family)